MNFSRQIAKHFREIFFGGNWTASCLKDHLSDVSWQESTAKPDSLNSIASLVYHIHYFPSAAMKVLQGEVLDANDELSFNHPPVELADDWQKFLESIWREGEKFAALVEKLPEEKLGEIFSQEKYGNYYRNIHGIIEHAYYHLGQIVLIKKLIRARIL